MAARAVSMLMGEEEGSTANLSESALKKKKKNHIHVGRHGIGIGEHNRGIGEHSVGIGGGGVGVGGNGVGDGIGVGVIVSFDNLLSTHIISRETCKIKRKRTVVVGADPERRRRHMVQWPQDHIDVDERPGSNTTSTASGTVLVC
jgi:hypothetical protein